MESIRRRSIEDIQKVGARKRVLKPKQTTSGKSRTKASRDKCGGMTTQTQRTSRKFIMGNGLIELPSTSRSLDQIRNHKKS